MKCLSSLFLSKRKSCSARHFDASKEALAPVVGAQGSRGKMLAPEYGAISAPAAKRSNHSPSEIHRWHSGSIGTSAVPEGRGLGEGCSWFGATTTLLICVMFYATVVPCIVVAATYLLAERAVQQRGPVSSAGEAELVGHVPFQFDWIRSITSVCIAVLVLVFYVVVVLFIEANCRCFTSQLKRRCVTTPSSIYAGSQRVK
eukprot:SAG31_NODE_1399_length_8500_cov_22.401857_3_plen_201_part_00